MFVDLAPLRAAAACLGCEEAQLTKALCTQNIKAGLDWIAKPNTTTYSQNVKDALSKVPPPKPVALSAGETAALCGRRSTRGSSMCLSMRSTLPSCLAVRRGTSSALSTFSDSNVSRTTRLSRCIHL